MPRTVENRVCGRNVWAIVLALGGGLAHGAVFPSLGVWPLAFVALAPLLMAVRGRSVGAGLVLGWAAGTVASGVAVAPWLAASAREFFGLGTPGALAVGVGATQMFGAVPIAVFGGAAAQLSRLSSAPGRVLAIAAAWTATEFGRSELLTGNPWALLGHALYDVPVLVQVADLGGALVVSFVLALTAAAIAECVGRTRREAGRALVLAAAVVALVVAYGAVRLSTPPKDGESLSIALVQGDVPNAWRNDPTRAEEGLRVYADLTRTVLPDRPALVVWPETAVGVLLEPNPRFRAVLGEALHAAGVPLVLGAPRAAPNGAGRVALFNAAHLFAPDGHELGFYDKRHLVPFAEYLPAPWLWGRDGLRPGDYTPGTTSGVFTVPVPFGVLICFEVIYPSLARELVAGGARVLVNLSNDAWFSGAAAREQHFAAVVLRAIELRRPIVRVANAGITAAVDAYGRVTARFPTDVRGAWTVAVTPSDAITLFARSGDLFAWSTVLGALVGLARSRSPLRGG